MREKGVRKGQGEVFLLKILGYAKIRSIQACVIEWTANMFSGKLHTDSRE